MNEFLELVKERPDTKLWKKGIFCPYCKSKNVDNFGTISTLVGYIGKDMNHTHTKCRCNDCGKEFTRETKGYDNVWFTDLNGKVLLGIPYCFENYVYTCKHCGGDVIKLWFSIDTDGQLIPLSSDVTDGNSIPVFKCKQCGKEIRSENDYIRAT